VFPYDSHLANLMVAQVDAFVRVLFTCAAG